MARWNRMSCSPKTRPNTNWGMVEEGIPYMADTNKSEQPKVLKKSHDRGDYDDRRWEREMDRQFEQDRKKKDRGW